MKNSLRKNYKHKGFTLVEMLVSLFIFSIVATIVIASFVQMVKVRQETKTIQQDMEDARTAMELMAKNIRMSSNVSSNVSSNAIYMFNNSQGECISYEISGGAIKQSAMTVPAGSDGSYCLSSNFNSSSYVSISSSDIGSPSSFSVTSTSPTEMGKVTMEFTVQNGSDKENIQTTVSLRDYAEVDPQ